MDETNAFPRSLSRRRAYVYVLPCRDENLLKIGVSRDPVQRLRTLHPRFFAFFDLDRAVLLETDFVREARAIERQMIGLYSPYQALAPLIVPDSAGGHTEWYRGIVDEVTATLAKISVENGMSLHSPLRTWLRERFQDSASLLHGWSAWMLEAIEYERFNLPAELQSGQHERTLRNVLDCYASLGIDLALALPAAVLRWYERRDDDDSVSR